jgi:uncharacterized protein (DUF342 family)
MTASSKHPRATRLLFRVLGTNRKLRRKGSRIKNRRVQVEVVNTISITNTVAPHAHIHLRDAAQETRQES